MLIHAAVNGVALAVFQAAGPIAAEVAVTVVALLPAYIILASRWREDKLAPMSDVGSTFGGHL
jgi:hypothetical protein